MGMGGYRIRPYDFTVIYGTKNNYALRITHYALINPSCIYTRLWRLFLRF
nr:MAG TPA: Pyridoxine 5'-phosphate oxidase [Caudoviricetes sp.]